MLGQFTNTFQALPPSVQNVITKIAESKLAREVILFGSRARGDHRPNSDYDIAVRWLKGRADEVLKFESTLNELPLTLFKIDLLDLENSAQTYQAEIAKEGKVLWQREA